MKTGKRSRLTGTRSKEKKKRGKVKSAEKKGTSCRSTVFVGVGSNLGDRKAYIDKAISILGVIKGVEVKRVSSIYETEPVGTRRPEKYLNGVMEIATNLSPQKLLARLNDIEKALGRRRSGKNLPRTIDLDILLFGRRRLNTKRLKIPHPRMHKREFVLRGLRELGCRQF